MTDADLLLATPGLEFGSGVVGICDICGTRQAVIVLHKERFKLCVIDFLNRTWVKSDRKPGAPLPLYRSDRIWFETKFTSEGKATAIVLSPTKIVKHPTVLITPDVFGLTTAVLDAGIRLAREGFEVLLPDVGKISSVGPGSHLALRLGSMARGLPIRSRRVEHWLQLYRDALAYLNTRDMVDPTKSAVMGISYGASLALALAAETPKISAVALAYPIPVNPPDLARAVSAPILFVGGTRDRAATRAKAQLVAAVGSGSGNLVLAEYEGARHNFLARDMPQYNLGQAEQAWGKITGFLRQYLLPPPPKPPTPPLKPAAPATPTQAKAPSSASSGAATPPGVPAKPVAPSSS
ncbi:MAG: dienelactone hydrolase family protein [Thermoplasmata archaeon]